MIEIITKETIQAKLDELREYCKLCSWKGSHTCRYCGLGAKETVRLEMAGREEAYREIQPAICKYTGDICDWSADQCKDCANCPERNEGAGNPGQSDGWPEWRTKFMGEFLKKE